MKAIASFNLGLEMTKVQALNPLKQALLLASVLFVATLLVLSTGVASPDAIAGLVAASQSRIQQYVQWFEGLLTNATLIHSLITGGAFAVLAFVHTLYKVWAANSKAETFTERTGAMPDFGEAEF